MYHPKAVANILHVELPLLLGNLRIKGYMQQHVTKFLTDVWSVVIDKGVGKFVALLNGIRSQTLVCLLSVPRTFFA